jgi:exopolysaccharide production protein ExoQ
MRAVALIAAIACFAFIGLLFRREFTRPDRQRISWAPFAWMFIAGSRFVSVWLSLQGPGGSVEGYSEGSPVDRAVFFVLIAWGAIILARRKIAWGSLFARNKWLVVYLLYCLASITWTDVPDVMIKRWVKDLGNPIMVLVLMTEQRPYDALVATVRRLAFVFVPLSVLFIKWFPEMGRSYSYGGFPTYSGVADSKNTLGLSCLMIVIVFAWSRLFQNRRLDWWEVILLALWSWVLYMANSATSLTCVVLALLLFVCAKVPPISRRPTAIIAVTASVVCLYMVTDSLFNIEDNVLALLGRDDTFTNRTKVWETVRPLQTNPYLGAGFMSFWNGERMQLIWDRVGRGINQAHNGYLELYLNLGYVGVAFIIVIAVSTLLVLRRQLKTDYPVAILRLCLVIVALLYNYTEASFYGINNMWVLFLLASINLPRTPVPASVRVPATTSATSQRRFGSRVRAAAMASPAPVRTLPEALNSTPRFRTRRQQ